MTERKVTAETLRADEHRRWKNRRALADAYDRAADVLDVIQGEHREAVSLLRAEAERWRTP